MRLAKFGRRFAATVAATCLALTGAVATAQAAPAPNTITVAVPAGMFHASGSAPALEAGIGTTSCGTTAPFLGAYVYNSSTKSQLVTWKLNGKVVATASIRPRATTTASIQVPNGAQWTLTAAVTGSSLTFTGAIWCGNGGTAILTAAPSCYYNGNVSVPVIGVWGSNTGPNSLTIGVTATADRTSLVLGRYVGFASDYLSTTAGTNHIAAKIVKMGILNAAWVINPKQCQGT